MFGEVFVGICVPLPQIYAWHFYGEIAARGVVALLDA
jgi:hypothetical protein